MYFLTALLELGGDLTLVRAVSLILKSHQPTGAVRSPHRNSDQAGPFAARCPDYNRNCSGVDVAVCVTRSLNLPLFSQLWQRGCVNMARRARSFIWAPAAGLWNRIPLCSAGATGPKFPRNKILFLSGWFLSGSLSAPVIMCPLMMFVCLDLESDGQRSITSGCVQIENM